MAAEHQETDRVAVKTYVPAYQRQMWDEHAAELDMSRSEFVRSMVQAGRRGFDPGGTDPETTPQNDSESAQETIDAETTGSDADLVDIDDVVLGLLAEETCLSHDEIVAAVTRDMEDRVVDSIVDLQEARRIKHDPRDGGYVLAE